MTRTHTFTYDPPLVDARGTKTLTTTGEVQYPSTGEEEWTHFHVDELARSVVAAMKAAGDPGPFQWRLREQSAVDDDDPREPSRPTTWVLDIKGSQLSNDNVLMLRRDQVPAGSDTWASV